jgi:RNA polymerase sigma-70 factor, ECF subfamily
MGVSAPRDEPGPRPAELGDDVLVARVRSGDRAAFRELYLRHARSVATAVARLVGDADLDDIVQDTFVRATDRLASLRSPSHLRPWLVTIAIRIAHSRRVRGRRRDGLLRAFGLQTPQSSDPRDRAPADDLSDALGRLPEEVRVPWFLHHVQGERLEDVAVLFGVSLATIKRRIASCESKLERRLGGPVAPRGRDGGGS